MTCAPNSVYIQGMSTVNDIKDTRQHPRNTVEHEINVMLTRELPEGSKRTFHGKIVDKSAIGFCVETSTYVSSGDLLRVCTDISSDSELYFDVRWVCNIENNYLFGCNFVDLTESEAMN